MSTAADLMGLGMPSQLALRIPSAGVGPTTLVTAGTNFATATDILLGEYMINVTSNTGGAAGLALPTVGPASGVDGARLGDQYIITNNSADSFKLHASTGVVIVSGGTAGTSSYTVTAYTTTIVWPFSSTQWNAIKGS